MNRVEESLRRIDADRIVDDISKFISSSVVEAKADGVVLGLSGGIDSSVTFVLCVKALGSDRVHPVIMPTSFTPFQDIIDALNLASMFKTESIRVDIDSIVDEYIRCIGYKVVKPIVEGNLRARVRMTILYYLANAFNLLVVGTSDRSEYMIGYFTKYGDGAADIQPILHLYKTQVRLIGRYIGLPDSIVSKPSAPMLFPGHTAKSELPADYDIIDQVLHGFFDLGLTVDELEMETGIGRDISSRILSMVESSKHKRMLPKCVMRPI
ncbi:MAG: NAD+ synthase [Candidatus Bathyarchaeia archaeon]|nr:NAD+ synthase [Candidatus Jordarchaeia archaeon]